MCAAKRRVCFTPDSDRKSGGFPHKVFSRCDGQVTGDQQPSLVP
jgi:hypothetical protein